MAGKKPFENLNVLIVSQVDSTQRVLTRVFTNCGAKVFVESGGHEAVPAVKKLGVNIVVFSSDVKRGGCQWFTHQLRGKGESDVDIIWYIGDKRVPYIDGYIKKPFKPINLVKAIAYNLSVLEDLKSA